MAKDYFHVKQVKAQELTRVLLTHFNQAQNISPWKYRYQQKDIPHFLEITFDENGEITNITLSSDFPKEELEIIEKKIQETLIVNQGTKIRQIICFCNEKITGHFRYKNLFQILPMPDDAPKPEVGVADHPFILEVAYEASSDFVINHSRVKNNAVIYCRLLNLLANQFISTGSRYTQFAWVFNTIDINNWYSEWKQLGYTYKGLKSDLEDFSSLESILPIERVPFKKYYDSFGRSLDSFKLPDNIEQSLDKAYALEKKKWRMFFMACSWYAQYQYTWQESNSSAYIALVTALECLVKEKEICKCCSQPYIENVEVCDCCKQPRYRITKNFQDFLSKYFPVIDQFPKEKKTIYHFRSLLAHGSDLLQADLEPWNFMMDAKEQEQRTLQYNLYSIVGIAIYNLHSGQILRNGHL